MRKIRIFTLLVLTTLMLISCNAKKSQVSLGNREFFFIKSHNIGPYYSAASAWARLITSNTEYIGVNSTTPVADNEKIKLLVQKKVKAAILKCPEANLAYHGDPFYWKEQQPVRAMFALWPSVYNLIARKDSGIRTIDDIKGKSIAIYSEKTVNGDILEYFLRLYGITSENTNIYRVRDDIGINLIIRKETDCIWYSMGYGEFSLISTTEKKSRDSIGNEDFVLVPVEQDSCFREFIKNHPYFYLGEFGAEAGFKPEMQLMTSSFVACSADLSENDAYRLTRLWWENMDFIRQYIPDTIELINMIDNRKNIPVPFHKGSLKYLSESGHIPM